MIRPPIALVVAAVVAGSCSSDAEPAVLIDRTVPVESTVTTSATAASSSAPPPTMRPDGTAAEPTNQAGRADTTDEIPHRLLVDDGDVGDAGTVAVITPGQVREVDPDAEILVDDVLLRFTLVESGTCPYGEFRSLVLHSGSPGRLHPVVAPPRTTPGQGCTDDINPHTVIVAVPRSELPSGDYSIWIEHVDPRPDDSDEMLWVEDGVLPSLGASELDG